MLPFQCDVEEKKPGVTLADEALERLSNKGRGMVPSHGPKGETYDEWVKRGKTKMRELCDDIQARYLKSKEDNEH